MALPEPPPNVPRIVEVLDPGANQHVVYVRMPTNLASKWPDKPWGTPIEDIGLSKKDSDIYPGYTLVDIEPLKGSPDLYWVFQKLDGPAWTTKSQGQESLIPGWYPFRPGNHGISRPGGGYPAFRPATKGEALPVIRDGEDGRSKRDGVAINIHKGGYNTTSSEGCQTIYPPEWPAFHALVHMELKRAGLKRFYYGLLDGPIV